MAHLEITQYVAEVNARYNRGDATEHTYRPALQKLLESLVEKSALSQIKKGTIYLIPQAVRPLVVSNRPWGLYNV
jgi:hypothetical protein